MKINIKNYWKKQTFKVEVESLTILLRRRRLANGLRGSINFDSMPRLKHSITTARFSLKMSVSNKPSVHFLHDENS